MMTPKKYGLELRLGVFSTFPPLGLGWGISVLIVYYPVTISFSPFFFFFTRLLPPFPLSSSPTHLLSLLTREKGNLLSLLQSGRREPPPPRARPASFLLLLLLGLDVVRTQCRGTAGSFAYALAKKPSWDFRGAAEKFSPLSPFLRWSNQASCSQPPQLRKVEP